VRINAKKVIYETMLPALLILGLVLSAWFYRADALDQVKKGKERLLSLPLSEQREILEAALRSRFAELEKYAETLSNDSPTNFDVTITKINESSKSLGFSLVAVIGKDGVLRTEAADDIDISSLDCWKSAVGGQSMPERTNLNEALRFAFAVPYEVNGQNQGSVIGFCTEKAFSAMLGQYRSSGAEAFVIFDSSGQIIFTSGNAGKFRTNSDVYTVLDELSAGEEVLEKDAEAVPSTVASGGSGTILAGKDFNTYYSYQPLDLGNWYMLAAVNGTYLSAELAKEKRLGPYSLVVVGFLALFLLVFFLYITHKRLADMDRERARYIRASTIDSLTGLYNKPGFEEAVKKAFDSLSADRVCVVVAFEVVSYRTYKELYGNEAGEQLLQAISSIINKYQRSGDATARFYSDHFVWFASGKNEEEIFSVFRAATKATRSHEPPFFLCGGIYLIKDRSLSVAEMVDKASVAKDYIKANFGTGIKIYNDSMLELQLQDAEIAGNMMKGLQNGEFVEYYQPKFNTDTELIVGAEALVRWIKPDGEIITPGRFIGLFERNGFVRRLDFYVFERVCRFIAESRAAGKTVPPVSVNFSRVHMHDQRFPLRLFKIVQKYGLEPNCFEIELTESAFIMDTKQQKRLIDSLRKYGFAVAIDDFGSGYSSLNMLKDFDVDTLKIDMKFLEGFEHGGKVGTVVTSVIRMAKWLGIPVVAEGVETKEQVEFLRSLGCEMIQGFYYSPPLCRQDYELLLESEGNSCPLREKPAMLMLSNINAALGGDSLLNALLDGILGGFAIYEYSGDRLEAIRVNRTYYELMGYPDASAFSEHSLNVLSQVYPPDTAKLLNACTMSVKTGRVQKVSARRYRFDGMLVLLDLQVKHIGGTAEKPLIYLTFIDATERLLSDRENELNKYCDALYAVFDEIIEFDFATDSIRLLSRNHEKCCDLIKSLEAEEKYWIEKIIYPEDKGKIEHYMALVKGGHISLPLSLDYRTVSNGKVNWVSASLVALSDGSYLFCKLDITNKKLLEAYMMGLEETGDSANFELSSGILNNLSAKFDIAEKMARPVDGEAAALLVVGLDSYELLLGVVGRRICDAFVMEACIRLKAFLGEDDVVGRIEEDELVVYLSRVLDAHSAYEIAQQIRDYIVGLALPGNISPDCSIGLFMIPPGQRDFEDARRKAEAACTWARAAGKNQCVNYHDKAD